MSLPRITERTLYGPILDQLSALDFKGVQESDWGGRFPDIIFWDDSQKYVLQVRIDSQLQLREVLRASLEAARRVRTHNVVTLLYPRAVRKPFSDATEVDYIALETPVDAVVETEYLVADHYGLSVSTILRQLKSEIDRKIRSTDIRTAAKFLRTDVENLATVLRRLSGASMRATLQQVVGRFDIFTALAQQRTGLQREKMRVAAIDLVAYLLLNQLLFYHIHSKRVGDTPALPISVASPRNLVRYFSAIRRIDFLPIYSFDLASSLPNNRQVIEQINFVLERIRLVRPENVELDLAGRLFQELLPWETRKILAAFYTNPVSAEILATLTIDKKDETIADLACGSGTLLVAAYRRKLRLSEGSPASHHIRFLSQITGIDIMPFAAHLTAINLSAQQLTMPSDDIRVSISDSLAGGIAPGQQVSPLGKVVQLTLLGGKRIVRRKAGPIATRGIGKPFRLDRIHAVLINPPFTDREKMPSDYRNMLNAETGDHDTRVKIEHFQRQVGGAVNLWGFFVPLVADFLVEGGKIGAVLPTNFLRGRATHDLRQFVLRTFHIRYLVRACKDYGFSEGSELRDFLLVAEKGRPVDSDPSGIVWLKRSIHEMSVEAAREIAEQIRSVPKGEDKKEKDFDITWVTLRQLLDYVENLTPLIGYSSLDHQRLFLNFEEEVRRVGE